jgi:hypothetical protein
MQQPFAIWLSALSAIVCLTVSTTGKCGELAVLSEKTWDQFVPHGKEVDAIYGDWVLRNDKIVVVIANPVPGRNANMTVKDVGGAIIDLTVRDQSNDQLSAYYPGARRFPYRLVSVSAQGNVAASLPDSGEGDALSFEAVDGKLLALGIVLRGDAVQLRLAAAAAANRPEVQLVYTLRNGESAIQVRSEFRNTSDEPMQVALVDDFRADRTFVTAKAGPVPFAWFFDKGWGQAYGVVSPNLPMRLSGSPVEPRVIEFLPDKQPTVQLVPGGTAELVRWIAPGSGLVAVRAALARHSGLKSAFVPHLLSVNDANGQGVVHADVHVNLHGEFYGNAITTEQGLAQLDLPPGTYEARVTALARGSKELRIDATGAAVGGAAGPTLLSVQLPAAPLVAAEISDVRGNPIPCKLQFIGVDGTLSPNFFDETGEHAVRNLYYSHNGRFTQPIAPGTYDVLISYGPEYDVAKTRIVTVPGETTPLRATLRRVVQSPGWISTDFHSHSSPSGDNVSSQLGRVLNLICEHIEFAPCTEHNRLDSYVPHLKALDAEKLMATCTGIELTSLPGTINHQNAFPLIMRPRTQDNGGPETDTDPELQIKRLALWDNSSDKLVQTNHPDMGEMFYDKDGDGQPDGGYAGMFAYQDVIEVHPIHDVLNFSPLRYNTVEDRTTKVRTMRQYNNSIFNWLQLLNQGRRLPGVVNTDAHYNFHGSGYIRNYVKCATDDPAQIDTMDIVHASEKGHVILTNGPYLEVALYDSDTGAAASGGERRRAIPGDDFSLPGGLGSLHVRVQCPNWFDIDRVQILLNGRPEKSLNWTRSANPEAFSSDVVKFDRKIPIEFKSDAHVIVIAAHEHTELGPVLGDNYGKHKPTAISNPIFVDTDGGGFKANGDTLGHPLPVKEQRPVSQPVDRVQSEP